MNGRDMRTRDGQTIDRRSLFAFAAALPAFIAAPAEACKVAIKSPRSAKSENGQVRELFEAWWNRDAIKFRASFVAGSPVDGPRIDRRPGRNLHGANPVPNIFGNFFDDERKLKRLILIVNTAAGVVVACSEVDQPLRVQPDCSGLPKLHLFLVTMSGLKPRFLAHVASEDTTDANNINIWSKESA